MKEILEKLLFILLLVAMLYQLPESLDKEHEFQIKVVQQHISHELSAKEVNQNANR